MSDDPRVGTTLADRYRLDGLLGAGGMGRVYAAEHVLMRKKLAVKVLHRELTTVPEVVKRFEREAMAAAHIEHPNVAAATDFGKLPDGSVFLVLEFVEGESLRDEVARGPLVPERALRIARQIASALASAHHLEIVHRDLKPENVMLVQKAGQSDFVKVLDFGIAKVPIGEMGGRGDSGAPITRAGMVFGTPEYMAPEQALGQSVDGRADLYALGTILYEMLAGVRPYSSKSQVGILGQQLANPVPPFATRAPGIVIPHSVEQVVMRLLAREPDERFQMAGEVVTALDELLRNKAAPDTRLFTQLGGSPREMLGSYPGAAPDEGLESLPLPSFADPSDSGLFLGDLGVAAGATALGDPVSPRAQLSALDPIGPRQPKTTAARPKNARVGLSVLERAAEAPALRIAARFVATRSQGLPAPLAKMLGRVSAQVLALALLGVLLLVATLMLVLWLSDGSPREAGVATAKQSSAQAVLSKAVEPKPLPAPSITPSSDMLAELERAKTSGTAALEALAKKHPENGEVLLALAEGRVNDKRYEEAVVSVSRALEVDPELNVSEKVASLLFQTAQSKSGRDETFQLLEGPMGGRGADIVYDISVQPGIKRAVKQRADKYLMSQAFEKASSPALNVAVALQFAERCEQKYALLLRAKNVGDARALALLTPLQKSTGCGAGGKGDCYPCLRSDKRLADAISALTARARK